MKPLLALLGLEAVALAELALDPHGQFISRAIVTLILTTLVVGIMWWVTRKR